MPTYSCTTPILGLICLVGTPLTARAAPGPRRRPPRMSGAHDKPVLADSRFPGRHPRPNGALLAPLGHTALRLTAERLRIHCRYAGGGCAVRHEYVIRNTGDATTVDLPFISPRMAVLAEVDGKRALVDRRRAPKRPRDWSSSGQGLDPATGKMYPLPGPKSHRTLRHHRVRVAFGARAEVTLTLISNSVGGYDRFRRKRTQPEVSFGLNRRKDHMVTHHELPLTDPAARLRTSADRPIEVTWTLPANLALGANTKLRCQSTGLRRQQQKCSGRLHPTASRLRWSMAEKYHWPVGVFVGAGVAFTHRGAEPLLRGGISVMVRRRKDVLSLAAETDAKERVALALTYQLYLPYAPHSMEMGGHFELGMALDLVPAVRPAFRAGAAFHISVVRVNLLFDLYPGELKKGGGPSWRGMVVFGIGF